MNVWTTLERAAHLDPDRVGVRHGDQSLTHGEFHRRAGRLAAFFREEGVRAGDRIAILDDNSIAFLEAYYAAAGLGAVLTPLNIRLTARELKLILDDAGARWLITSGRFRATVETILESRSTLEGIVWVDDMPHLMPIPSCSYRDALTATDRRFAPEPVDDHAIAHLYYTSGTTGDPKGVMLTHRNVVTHALGAIAELRMTDTDVWAHIAPMFHLADAWAVFAVTWIGGTHVVLPRFEPEAALQTIEQGRVTITNLIPTMLNLMIKHPDATRYDTSSLRLILSGGAPIAPEVVRRTIETFGCEYAQTYGMTETSPYLTLSLLKAHLKRLDPETQLAYQAKTGRPFITVDLKVVNDGGREVADDEREVGEIWVRGDTVTPGYWNREAETREAFQDGWLKTGDLAVVDAHGYVTIVDRKKDVIVSGGENVYSVEVENAIYRHEAVLEAAVFGVPHEVWGEAVRAAVVLKPEARLTESELLEFLKGELAGFKTPKAIDFLGALPRTGSGKIFKQALRDRFRAHDESAT